MPTYEYRCKGCGANLEVVQAFTDDPLTTCEACGGDLRKVFGSVGISFKGSGFYKTDSRSGGAKSSSGADKAGSDGSAGSGDSGSTAGSGSSSGSEGGTGNGSGTSGGSSSSGDKAPASTTT